MPVIDITDESVALLMELREGLQSEYGDPRTEAQLVDDAIVRLHRGFFGWLPEDGGPDQPTGPFRKVGHRDHRPDTRGRLLLRRNGPPWRRVWCWLCHKHSKTGMRELQRRYLRKRWPEQDEVRLFNPATVAIIRYRYRGSAIPSPWATTKGSAA